MAKYLKQFTKQIATPQMQPIPGTNQVRNSNLGYVWEASAWDRLKRFLVLGTEGGSFYASQQTLTAENANHVLQCIREDGVRVVRETLAISDAGRAPKNDPAIFVLALVAAHGSVEARRAAFEALPKVCRIGTHLFQFAEYVQSFRGWGRALRRGVASWYEMMEPRSLAYQVVKYRQRDGWTHTDTLRLSHPVPADETRGAIYKWVTKRDQATWARDLTPPEQDALAFIWAFERMQAAEDVDTVLKLIADYDLPREALPTQWLNEPAIWEALLAKMPMTAMIRNLGVMAKVGLLKPLSAAEQTVVDRLGNADLLRKARIHPIAILSALRVYARGRGVRGDGQWESTPRISDALNDAFYLAFGAVEPADKRLLLALDVSGSMAGGEVAGVPGLTPRDASAAMALVTAKTEPQYGMVAFAHQMEPLNISPKMRLDDAVKAVSNIPFGGTDCALPMLYALEKKLEVDAFVVYTDSETWHGKIHPAQALWQYREKTGIPARLIVVAMIANRFSIADPNDAGMLDCIGFDSATPQIINDFARGEI
jgi:60 kDa SS-A/Ro ribonucleoprotein